MESLSKNKKKKQKKKKKKLQLQDGDTATAAVEGLEPDTGRIDDTKPAIDIKIEEEWRQQGEEALNETLVGKLFFLHKSIILGFMHG